MKTTIVFTDDRHTDKKAVITVEEGKGGRLEFFPSCGEDDKEQRSYAHLAISLKIARRFRDKKYRINMYIDE